MRTFKKAPPTIEFSDGLLLAAWLILATTPISTNSKGSSTVPVLWTGHAGCGKRYAVEVAAAAAARTATTPRASGDLET